MLRGCLRSRPQSPPQHCVHRARFSRSEPSGCKGAWAGCLHCGPGAHLGLASPAQVIPGPVEVRAPSTSPRAVTHPPLPSPVPAMQGRAKQLPGGTADFQSRAWKICCLGANPPCCLFPGWGMGPASVPAGPCPGGKAPGWPQVSGAGREGRKEGINPCLPWGWEGEEERRNQSTEVCENGPEPGCV